MLHETWRDEYDRMKRSFALLERIGDPAAEPQDVLTPFEVVCLFCSHAFHLRDHIAAHLGTNKASINAAIQRLDNEVIKPSLELSACRDVANGAKHVVLHGESYVTRTNQDHAEVVGHNITIGVPPIRIAVLTEATAIVIHPDGTTDADEPVVPQPKPAPASAPETEGSDHGGYAIDTFDIDINGQRHDARYVGAKAIAAWDAWLKSEGML